MESETEASTARLLEETGAAHGDDETTALGGGADENWSGWYAAYLLAHGLPDLILAAATLGADRLGAILARLDTNDRRAQPGGDWPDYDAERLGAMVRMAA